MFSGNSTLEEIKNLEAQLSKTERRQSQLTKNIQEVFWLYKNHHFEYISPSCENILGTKHNYLFDNPSYIYDIFYIEDKARMCKILTSRDFLETGYYNEDFRIITSEGSIKWIHGMSFPIFNNNGEVTSYAGIWENITERKLAEQDLERRHTEISNLYELHSQVSKYIKPTELLTEAQSNIIKMLNIASSAVYLYDMKTHIFTMNSYLGISTSLANGINSLNGNEGLIGLVSRSKEPLILKIDPSKDTKFTHLLAEEGIKSLWLFPILSSGEIIGLLLLANNFYRFMDTRDEAFMELICSQLATLMDKSLLYDKVTQELKAKKKIETKLLKEKTEWEIAQRNAEQNWIHLDSILKNLDAIVWEINKDGIFLLTEGRSLEKLGCKPGEVNGMSIFDFNSISEKSLNATKDVLNGIYCEYEDTHNNNNFIIKYSPLFDQNGNVSGAVGMANDITSIKKMEHDLRENETRLKLASQGAMISYWDWNVQNSILIQDELLAVTLGYEVSEISPIRVGSFHKLIHPEDLKKSKALFKKHFLGETEYYECELRIKRKNGEWVYLLHRGKVIERNAENKPIRVLGIYIDITQRKKAEEIELLFREKEKEESLKNEFFANISHELKTPVNVIYSAIQLESKYISDLDVKQILKYNKTIKQNCLRLTRIINNIIDTTKIEAGFFKPLFMVENIVSLVEYITLSVISYAEFKHIKITFDTEFEELYINCDSCFIERIILNLLSNAVKYGKENGNIHVSINKEQDFAIISVKDDGIGIPKHLQRKVFKRFQRVDTSMSRSNEGSGIGLSLVKSLVEIQNGDISLKSKLNEGTELLIKFPIVEESTDIDLINTPFSAKPQNHILEKINIEFSDIYI